jgi:hypothetical protein
MNKLILPFFVVASLLFFASCGGKKQTPWDDPLSYYSDNIENYHEAALGEKSKVRNGNQAVYVDFSDGLVQAYTSETNKKVVDFISQKMVGSSIDWYGLGKNHNGVGKLVYANDRDIYNKVISGASYVDIMAPIEEALKKITTSKNDGLLITDFEEYTPDGKEQKYAYAKDYFIKWVQEGNSITMYYAKYIETNKTSKISGEKNLYFVLFNYGEVNENSLVTKFNKAIEGRGSELIGLNKFEINPNPYSISNKYGGKEKTGLTIDPDIENKAALDIGDNEGALLFYRNGFLNNERPFESFEFGQSLNDIYDFYFKDKRRFAKNLFLDASNNSSYILKDVKVQVTDVTSDYVRYIQSEEAKKNVPVLDNDEGNNKVWSQDDAENPIIAACYEKNTNKLKKEYSYSYTPSEPLTEIFDYDASIFSDRLRNSPKEVELVTTFHKNFAGKFTTGEDQIILRVDYIVSSSDENYSAQLDAFKWNSIINVSNGVNNSLYESIRNTLQAVKPSGILYSYYLKIEPNK